MAVKTVFALCAQALLIQTVLSQCTSGAAVEASGIAGPFGLKSPIMTSGLGLKGLASPLGGLGAPLAGLAAPCGYNGLSGSSLAYNGISPSSAPAIDFTPTRGGGLTVTSASAIAPTGISIVSENAFEGILAITGDVPFVGTTGMEGVVPNTGVGAVNHACGNGINAMASDATAFAPGFAAGAFAPAQAVAPAVLAPGLSISSNLAPAVGCGSGLAY